MKLIQLTLLLFTLAGALASIFPEGEDEVAWHARIDANIDKNRKSDVTIRVKIDPAKLCKTLTIFILDKPSHQNVKNLLLIVSKFLQYNQMAKQKGKYPRKNLTRYLLHR